MKRFSKPLGRLLDFKGELFDSNDVRLEQSRRTASTYSSQPRRRVCKNCSGHLDPSPSLCFTQLGVEYRFCQRCGHCNGGHEDTDAYCRSLYTADRGRDYARDYSAADVEQYQKRVLEVYLPKARFLADALGELGESAVRLADFGAGAGYFVSAATACGFRDVIGYEPSETLVDLGNQMMGTKRLVAHHLSDIVALVEGSTATVASFIGVLEHLQKPRDVLGALSRNDAIRYVFISVPLFSPAVVLESVFHEVAPRQLVAGHTHLYTERSIQYFCDEFGFCRRSEWWFGLDVCDLYRDVLVSLQKATEANEPLQAYWNEYFAPLIDRLQCVFDEAQACSEVHMLLGKEDGARSWPQAMAPDGT